MSQSWNSGYVADVAYVEGFYIQQSPARMALACLSGNVAIDLPEPDDQVCYLELGCGVGIGALLTAAANPGWQVTAIDYNPAHIAIATGLARATAC
jgi:predicted O-methyltransferase YrrM